MSPVEDSLHWMGSLSLLCQDSRRRTQGFTQWNSGALPRPGACRFSLHLTTLTTWTTGTSPLDPGGSCNRRVRGAQQGLATLQTLPNPVEQIVDAHRLGDEGVLAIGQARAEPRALHVARTDQHGDAG